MLRPLTFAVAASLALPVAAVASPALAGPVPATAEPPVEVVGWLQPLAGRTAIRCGTHHPEAARSTALACAADAIRQARPFWVVLDEGRPQAGVWTGIVRNADGRAWSVRFEIGSKQAGTQRRQSVTVLTCRALEVEDAGLRCLDA